MEPTTTSRAPWLRRALLLFVALTGSAVALSSCFSSDTTECSTGLVCPTGSVCNATGDGCIAAGGTCGNMMVDGDEACDDGNFVDGDGCSANCESDETCGNNYVDNKPEMGARAETCDNGNTVGGDGCSADCKSDERCGNDILDTDGLAIPEVCDEGDTTAGDGCSANCLSRETCGNGVTDTQNLTNPEVCDDHNNIDGDGCSADCRSNESCGNGTTDDKPEMGARAEQCDDRNMIPGDGCSANCLSDESCGNDVLDTDGVADPEFCDDGNTEGNDGCAFDCQGGTDCPNTNIDPGEQCDDGNFSDTDACTTQCLEARCGDGFTQGGVEMCDTSGASASCNVDCTPNACGDGKLNPASGEQCDTAGVNTTQTASCDNDCTLSRCGDNHVNSAAGEFCDAATLPTAMCDTDCSARSCGDGLVNLAAGEQCDDMGTVGGDGCSSGCLLEPFSLAVVAAGTGTGGVSSAPMVGITCTNVIGSDCVETYAPGAMVTLTAAPTAVSYFVGWSGACTGTGTCMVTMSQARTVTATFDLNRLTVAKGGNGTGGVTSSPTGITCTALPGGDCTEDYALNTMVTLTAAPAANNVFGGWSGGGCSGMGTCVTTMTNARTVTATFTLAIYTLTVNRTGTGTGTVTGTGINCGTTCSAMYNAGTEVTLTATPTNANNIFTGWSGACTGTGSCVVTMTAATAVTANFTPARHQLTVVKAGLGSGTVTSAPAGITCGATCSATYDAATVVTLTANATDGNSAFTGWSVPTCTGTGNGSTCVVTMNQAETVTATFAPVPRTLTVVPAGNGTGTVTSSPAGINCGATCSATYNANTQVTLNAVAAADSVFTGWSGACTGSSSCVVTMSAAQTVTATFALRQFTLTVVKTGASAATGTVAASPNPLTCVGNVCTATYNAGVTANLTATAGALSTFTAWSGGGCSGSAGCAVVVNANTTVTANFEPQSFALTVTKGGTGAGTVTSVPSGINCGATCTANFTASTSVTLVAVASTGSTFTGWAGDCTGTGLCTVSMTAAQNVTANFALNTYALDVVRNGNGTGSVTSAPAGINCPAVGCSATFNHATSVTLTAVPTGGAITTWSVGGCTGNTCTFSMTAARTVTATFTLASATLTVTKVGSTGTGTVTSTPAGINCGATCSQSILIGNVVILTATPSANSNFVTWSGAACASAGTSPTCVVTVTAAQTVNAEFALNTYPLTVMVNDTNMGTVTSDGTAPINCGTTCNTTVAHGAMPTLTATAAAGHQFMAWGGACAGQTGTICTVPSVTAATNVTATFIVMP